MIERSFFGGGEMGSRMDSHDWEASMLGPVAQWPESLKTTVLLLLGSRYPMFVWWGPELVCLYNDAYIPVLGRKHPAALGQSARDVWADIWDTVGPLADAVMREGRSTRSEELLLVMERHDYREETYFTFSYSPVPDRDRVGGVFCACWEDTPVVLGRRRLRTLRELAARTAETREVKEACDEAAAALAEDPLDLPFALIYLLDGEATEVTLAGAAGIAPGTPACPVRVALDDPASPWPFAGVRDAGEPRVVEGVFDRFGQVGHCPWPDPPKTAVVLPVIKQGQDRLAGFLVAGLSPWRKYDDDYAGFLSLLSGGVATAIAGARHYEEERRRTEALAQLDRARTAFFSNVSHEFRTPLTLLLGPLEDELNETSDPLPPERLERLRSAHRNSLRLLKLVNTLLDFSRIEAGRVQASYEPVDLAALTADLASVFRSTIERAGLRLLVDCTGPEEPVYVDRDMWEKIVLNLVSNAFKHTFEGGVEVSLRPLDGHVQLCVRDTGTGIPPAELPRIFERFHRVEGARGRTMEGTGIGLALVQELVKLHGGTITVESEVDRGSAFTVTISRGAAHLAPDRIGAPRTRASTALGAEPFVEEAARWIAASEESLPRKESGAWAVAPRAEAGEAKRPAILLADDNADMRDYVCRLLSGRYAVEAVDNGEAALEALRRRRPDLLISDVMMPRMDGFELLSAVRSDPALRSLPVVLVSARAGEESRIEGMEAGADDYLVKPFGARELLARVEAHLAIAHVRRQAERSLLEWKNRYEAAIKASELVLYDWNPRTGEITWAGSVEPMLGYGLGELNGSIAQWMTFIHPEDRAAFESGIQQCLYGGHCFRMRYRVRRKDGRYITVEDRGDFFFDERDQAIQMIGFVEDVTQRLETEQALREREDELRLVADSVPVLISYVDNDRRFRFINRQYELWFGEPSSAFLGRTVEEILGVEAYPVVKPFVDAALRGEEVTYETWLNYRKVGRRFVKITCVPRRDDQGRVMGYFALVAELTERKVAEEALSEAARHKDDFLAMLAHELRNPLAAVRNAAQVLKLIDMPEPMAKDMRDIIERQVAHMADLLDDLLDVSRISRGKILLRQQPTDLVDILQGMVADIRPTLAQAGLTVDVQLPDRPITVFGDPTRLSQVIGNLLHNAAKFTDPGGHVTATLRRNGSDGMAVLRVKDTGLGIRSTEIAEIFEPFRQSDRSLDRTKGGLGLGLALVKGLVELHGGSVYARSDGPGCGSEFEIRLPMQEPDDKG